jgi:DNA-binding transcriptional LysR family regulator
VELRQLEYLVAVVEEANFTRAAERVHVSQSGISAQIRELERDLGATLIDRSGRSATLTTAGRAVVEHARAALASADAIRRAVDDVNGLIRGRLVVGMVTGCTVVPLFNALASFHGAHPGVDIVLVEDNSDRLVEQVRTGSMDLALVGTAGVPPVGLDALVIISEGLVAAVPDHHALANSRQTTLAALSEHPLVCLPVGTGIRTAFDQACRTSDVRVEIALQASAPEAVADLAARGMGIAILSASMAENYADRLKAVPIQDVHVPAVLALIWPRTKSPALQQLLRYSRLAFGSEPPRS